MRSPDELLLLARHILDQGSTKPSQAVLRRAVSTVYYALFRNLAKNSADLLTSATKKSRSKYAWQQVYQGLNHGPVRKACEQKATMERFPESIQKFGKLFTEMQQARNKADYNPYSKFSKSIVEDYIDRTEEIIKNFNKETAKDRNAFCVYVLFRPLK